MKKFLRTYFVPNEDNNHAPRILHLKTLLILLALAFAVEVLFFGYVFVGFYRTNSLATIVANVLTDRTNASRLASNVPALTVNSLLQKAAQMKADDMARNSYFAHTSPSGVTPWHWFKEVGYRYSRAGENLAINFADSEDVVQAWLNSPTHRGNIMNVYYSEIGIGMARGTYEGQETVFIVQLFGKPLKTAQNPPAPPQPKPQKPVPQPQPKPEVPEEKPVNPIVAGSETQVVNVEASIQVAPDEPVFREVPAKEPVRYSSFVERILAKPRAMTNAFYLTLATLVLLALTLTAFIRTGVPQPHLLINGVMFLVMIGSALLVNYYVATAAGQVF